MRRGASALPAVGAAFTFLAHACSEAEPQAGAVEPDGQAARAGEPAAGFSEPPGAGGGFSSPSVAGEGGALRGRDQGEAGHAPESGAAGARSTAGADSSGGAGGSPDAARCGSGCSSCYAEGHGDLFVDYAPETGLRLLLRTELEPGKGELLHAPDDVCIFVGYERHEVVAAAGGRPEGSAWDPLGVPANTAFWHLPAVATEGTPWLGTAVAPLPASAIVDGDVVLELDEPAPGTGAFSAYVTSAFGEPSFLLSSAAGVRELVLQGGSHAHMNWAFASPGIVELTFTARAKTPQGAALASEPATFRFVIASQ